MSDALNRTPRTHVRSIAATVYGYKDHGAAKQGRALPGRVCSHCGLVCRYTRVDPLSVYGEDICFDCDSDRQV